MVLEFFKPKGLLVLLALAIMVVLLVFAAQASLAWVRTWNPPSVNKGSDQYDARWWNTRPISGDEWRELDMALRAAQNDTEFDGAADAALMDVLDNLGVNVDNAVDARNAANHLVNRGYNMKKEQKEIQKEQKDAPQP